MQIGDTIKFLRKKKGVSQGVMCKDLDINRSNWSLIENNHRKPTYQMLEKFSKYIGVPIPLIFFFSLDEQDVPKDKKDVFRLLKPTMNDLIFEIFNTRL